MRLYQQCPAVFLEVKVPSRAESSLTREDTVSLIECYRYIPCLWDNISKVKKNRDTNQKGYEQLLNEVLKFKPNTDLSSANSTTPAEMFLSLNAFDHLG